MPPHAASAPRRAMQRERADERPAPHAATRARTAPPAPTHALTATPPRRGSPAPLKRRPRRLHRLHAAEEQVELGEADDLAVVRRAGLGERRERRCPARRRRRRPRSARAARRPPRARRRPWSTTPTIVCSSAERMRLEPALPSTSSTSPSRSTIDGAIMLGIRRPAGCRWKPSGLRSSSPITLLRCMPVPGTTTPEPSPLVHVALHARPSASSTEMCVVAPRREARKRSRKPVLARARRRTPACARPARRAIASTTPRSVGGAGAAVEQRERVGEQRAAGRRRRVGQHVAVAVADPHRLALDRAIAGEIARASASRRARAASRTPRARRRRGRTARRPRARAARAHRRARGCAAPRPRAARVRPAPTARRTRASTSAGRRGSRRRRPARAFSATPSRASRAAGAASSASGIVPQRRAASQTPAGAP